MPRRRVGAAAPPDDRAGLKEEQKDRKRRDKPFLELLARPAGGERAAVGFKQRRGSLRLGEFVELQPLGVFAGLEPHLEPADQADEIRDQGPGDGHLRGGRPGETGAESEHDAGEQQ